MFAGVKKSGESKRQLVKGRIDNTAELHQEMGRFRFRDIIYLSVLCREKGGLQIPVHLSDYPTELSAAARRRSDIPPAPDRKVAMTSSQPLLFIPQFRHNPERRSRLWCHFGVKTDDYRDC